MGSSSTSDRHIHKHVPCWWRQSCQNLSAFNDGGNSLRLAKNGHNQGNRVDVLSALRHALNFHAANRFILGLFIFLSLINLWITIKCLWNLRLLFCWLNHCICKCGRLWIEHSENDCLAFHSKFSQKIWNLFYNIAIFSFKKKIEAHERAANHFSVTVTLQPFTI